MRCDKNQEEEVESNEVERYETVNHKQFQDVFKDDRCLDDVTFSNPTMTDCGVSKDLEGEMKLRNGCVILTNSEIMEQWENDSKRN